MNHEHNAARALIQEERWVPVTESGDRWRGRTHEAALECLAQYPAHGRGGITHIEHEVRFVTEWRTIHEGADE